MFSHWNASRALFVVDLGLIAAKSVWNHISTDPKAWSAGWIKVTETLCSDVPKRSTTKLSLMRERLLLHKVDPHAVPLFLPNPSWHAARADILGGTIGVGCSETKARTNVRNSLISCRRAFISVDKSLTDLAKDCNNGWEFSAAPFSLVRGVLSVFVGSSTSASSDCLFSLWAGPVQYLQDARIHEDSWLWLFTTWTSTLTTQWEEKRNSTAQDLWCALEVKSDAKWSTKLLEPDTRGCVLRN